VASIERTAYPRFRHEPNARELQDLFTPAHRRVTVRFHNAGAGSAGCARHRPSQSEPARRMDSGRRRRLQLCQRAPVERCRLPRAERHTRNAPPAVRDLRVHAPGPGTKDVRYSSSRVGTVRGLPRPASAVGRVRAAGRKLLQESRAPSQSRRLRSATANRTRICGGGSGCRVSQQHGRHNQ